MKYLKEGKWEDFKNGEASNLLKKLEEIKAKYKEDIADINNSFVSIHDKLRDEIALCMVDLEDYLINYSPDMAEPDKCICVYEYKLGFDGLKLLNDLIFKLKQYIGEGTFSVYCYNKRGDAYKYKKSLGITEFPVVVAFYFKPIQIK